jgi:Lrp/AsnC family transcriptional regulator, leucine-responsive regulatory protein
MMPILNLDAVDRRILENLQREGRLTNMELAERVGLSPSPCLRRLRLLEDRRIICGYSAKIDRQRVGLDLTVFIAVRLQRHGEKEVARFRRTIEGLSEITACYITSGDHDFLLQVVVPDLSTYRHFVLERLTAIAEVRDIHSSFVIETLKEGAPLPLAHLK